MVCSLQEFRRCHRVSAECIIKKQPYYCYGVHFFPAVCTASAIRELADGGPTSYLRGVKMQSKHTHTHTQTPWYVCRSAIWMCVYRRQLIWVGGDATAAITRKRFDDGRQLWNLYLRFNNLPVCRSDTCAAHFLPCWQHLRSRTAIAFPRAQKIRVSISRRAIFQSALFCSPRHFGSTKQLKINRCWTFNFASQSQRQL